MIEIFDKSQIFGSKTVENVYFSFDLVQNDHFHAVFWSCDDHVTSRDRKFQFEIARKSKIRIRSEFLLPVYIAVNLTMLTFRISLFASF